MHSSSSATSRSPTPDLRQCTREPPSSSCVTSSPTAARTRCGPASAIDPRPLTIGTKSASPGMYAVPAAHGPISAATCGMTPRRDDLLAEQVARAGEQRADRLLDARARAVEQPHHRHALGQRQLAQPRDLDLAGHAHRPGHDREVVGGDRDQPAVDLAVAGDRRRRPAPPCPPGRARSSGCRRAGPARRTCPRRRAGRCARARSACRRRAAWRSAPRRRRAARPRAARPGRRRGGAAGRSGRWCPS